MTHERSFSNYSSFGSYLPMNYYIAEKVQCEYNMHADGPLLLLMRLDSTLSKECVRLVC